MKNIVSCVVVLGLVVLFIMLVFIYNQQKREARRRLTEQVAQAFEAQDKEFSVTTSNIVEMVNDIVAKERKLREKIEAENAVLRARLGETQE